MKTLALALLLGNVGVAGAEAPIEIEGTYGYLDQQVVQRAVDATAASFDACYRPLAESFRYLGGLAYLKIRVGRDGVVKKAWVDNGDLGSWKAEKCLLRLARTMAFGPPRGGDALVEVPLQFLAWTPADPGDGTELTAKLPRALARCPGAPATATVVAYVGPGGRLKSTGFVGEVPEAWADCATAKLKVLRVRDPRGRVLKVQAQVRRRP